MLSCGKVVGKWGGSCLKVCEKVCGESVGKFRKFRFACDFRMIYTFIANVFRVVLRATFNRITEVMMRFARFPHSLLILLNI